MEHEARLKAALADRYRIQRELGSGGMARVYLARDLKHDRDVAKEMGHVGRDLVDRAYGHLGDVRPRTDVVDYRANHHQEFINERLAGAKTESQEVP